MLVGRSAELARLDALAVSAHVGNGGRLILVGDPGMGKSSLLCALERQARRRGVRVVLARATDALSRPELPLLEGLLQQATETGRPPEGAEPTAPAERRALEMLLGLVRAGPVLLMIDDADLADLASMRALCAASERLGPSCLAIAISTRPQTLTCALLPPWPQLVVGPLDREAALAVLRAALGPRETSPILDQIAEALHDHPLMLESAAHLFTTDQIAGRAPLPDPVPVPASLVTAWAPILDRLGQPAQDALLDLAACGGRLDLLTTMADSPETLALGLDEAAQSGIAIPDCDGQPEFRSPILREVLLTRASAALRRRVHRRAAVAAQRLDLAPGVIVDHLARSVITADDATAAELAALAQQAEHSEHYAVAARAWEVAALTTTVPSDRVGFAQSAIRVSFDIGLPVAEDLMRIVAEDRDPRTAAHLAGIRAEQRADLDPEAALPAILGQVELAERTSPDLMPTLLLDVVGIALQLGDTRAALEAAERYAQLDLRDRTYPQRPDPPWTSNGVLAAALFQDGQVARAMPLRQAAIDAAGASDPRAMDLPMLMSTIGLDDILLDISPAATDRLLVAAERAKGDSGLLPCLYGIQGWRAKARGDWQTARAFLLAGRPEAEAAGLVQPWLGMTALSVELAAQCGDDEVLRVDARRLREVGSRFGDRRRLATLDRALGLRALVDGRLGDAVIHLSAAADVEFLGRGLRDAVLPARVDLIEVLVRSGAYAEAARRHAELHCLLTDMGDPLATALDERAAALVTGGEEAESHYRAALDAHAQSGEPFEQARTHMLLGEHLRRNRRRSQSRAHLQSAVHAFDGLGAAPWSARASQELRASGGQPGGAGHETSRDVSALTSQERAVATSVASGMSNREVAETLFLSPRTVEYHLGNVYRKLEVHGRGALARALDSAPADSSATQG